MENITLKQCGLYTVAETAALLETDIHRVYDLIRAGLLPALKLGGYKIRPATLEAFLEAHEGYDMSNPLNPVPLKSNLVSRQEGKLQKRPQSANAVGAESDT